MQEQVDRYNTKISLILQNVTHFFLIEHISSQALCTCQAAQRKCDCVASHDYKDNFAGHMVGNLKRHSFYANIALITK